MLDQILITYAIMFAIAGAFGLYVSYRIDSGGSWGFFIGFFPIFIILMFSVAMPYPEPYPELYTRMETNFLTKEVINPSIDPSTLYIHPPWTYVSKVRMTERYFPYVGSPYLKQTNYITFADGITGYYHFDSITYTFDHTNTTLINLMATTPSKIDTIIARQYEKTINSCYSPLTYEEYYRDFIGGEKEDELIDYTTATLNKNLHPYGLTMVTPEDRGPSLVVQRVYVDNSKLNDLYYDKYIGIKAPIY